MSCGLPPIATNAGGVPELVTHGHDGFIEAVGDIESQADRVASLLENEDLRLRMSQAARQTAIDRFATSLIIPQYEQYYAEILQRQSPRP